MKLILLEDDGTVLDEVDVAEDEFDYAQIDGEAATVLLGSLHKGRMEVPWKEAEDNAYNINLDG